MTLAWNYAIADGRIDSRDASYTLARAGTGAYLVATEYPANSYLYAGQYLGGGESTIYESFLRFDLSYEAAASSMNRVPEGATILDVDFSIYVGTDSTTQDFIINAYANPWTSPLQTSEWVPGATLNGMTPIATLDTAGMGTGRKSLVNAAGMIPFLQTSLNAGGIAEILIASSRTASGDAPGASSERVMFWSQINSGPSLDERLLINFTYPDMMVNF